MDNTKSVFIRVISIILIFCTLLMTTTTSTFAIGYPNVMPNQSNNTSSIMYYMDLTDDTYGSVGSAGDWYGNKLAITTIQGIVNRDAPRLFLNTNYWANKQQDIEWKQYYESIGFKFVKLDTLDEVVKTFKSFFKGIVTYGAITTLVNDRNTAAMAAANVANLTDRIPVSTSFASSYANNYGLTATSTLTITDTFEDNYDSPVTIDGRLENYSWSTNLDVQNWMYNNILKFCNPHEINLMIDEANDLCAERKIFLTLLRSSDTNEKALLQNVYTYYNARNGTFTNWGYGATEDVDLDLMAQYGGYISLATSNLSFHNKVPTSKTSFKTNTIYTKDNVTVENKYYIAFVNSDQDTLKTPVSMQYGAWQDPARGQVPISWGFPAGKIEEFPALANYYYSTATENDCFLSGGASALGFADYDELPADAISEHMIKGAYDLQKSGQKIIDLYTTYGAIGTFDKTKYGALGAKLGIDAFLAATPSGADYETWNGVMVINRPDIYPTRPVDVNEIFSSSLNWTKVNGTWAVESGEYSQSTASGLSYQKNSSTAYTNAQAKIKKISTVMGKAGLVFRRGSTGTNYYNLYLKDGNKIGLEKVINGTSTIIGSEVDFAHSLNTAYTLKVVADGTSIKCYVNNVLKISSTDSQFTSGYIGLMSTCHSHFDDVKLCKSSQTTQIVNIIKSRTVNISKAKPFFYPGPITQYMNYDNNWIGSEPGAGEVLYPKISELKAAMDSLNASYPGQFKFTRIDELVAAARKQYSNTLADRTPPIATAVEGLGTSTTLSALTCANMRVRITENTNIATNAVTLKWTVPGKSGTGSVVLGGSATSGVDLSFKSENVNLITPISGGIDTTDKINFWVEGSDVAGNSFDAWHDTSTDPLFTVTMDQTVVGEDIFSNWAYAGGVTLTTDTVTRKNGSTSMKAVFPNADWSNIGKWGSWNADGYDGIGMWVKSTTGTIMVKLTDGDNTVSASPMSVTPNQWTYVYKPFNTDLLGGDGVLNASNITAIEMLYHTSYGGPGATVYFDDIGFVKNSKITVDNDRYKDWFHSENESYSYLYPTNESSLGSNLKLKCTFFGSGATWQSATIRGKWNAHNLDGLGMSIASNLQNSYVKLMDADGTYLEGNLSQSSGTLNYRYLSFASGTVSGGDGVFNRESITSVSLMWYRPWGDGTTWYSYYYDDIAFIKQNTTLVEDVNIADTITAGKWKYQDGSTVPVSNGVVTAGTSSYFKLDEQIHLGDTVEFMLKSDILNGLPRPTDWQLHLGMLDNAPGTLFWQTGASQIGYQLTPTATPNQTKLDLIAFNDGSSATNWDKRSGDIFDGNWHKLTIKVIKGVNSKIIGKLSINGDPLACEDELAISGQDLQSVFSSGILTFYTKSNYNLSIKPVGAQVLVDSESYDSLHGTYNCEKTNVQKHSGNYSIKAAFHQEGPQWQAFGLTGRWDANQCSNITFWIKAPIANGYIKLYDADGTSVEANVTPTANQWSIVSASLSSNVNGGNGVFNKDQIVNITFLYYTGWQVASSIDYIFYYDDIIFNN